MDHNFIPSLIDSTRCAKCRYTELDHSEGATCEVCGATGSCRIFTDMLMCSSCIEKEIAAVKEHQSPEKQQARADAHNAANNSHKEVIERARTQDMSIVVKTDIFNAETVAIAEITRAIDANGDITNKQFAKCAEIKLRIERYQKIIFQAQKDLADANSGMYASQNILNELASKLRSEEREKLKIQDINYQPIPPKVIKARAVASRNPNQRKWTIKSVRDAASKYDVPADYVQMLCVAKNMTPDEAGQLAAKQLKG